MSSTLILVNGCPHNGVNFNIYISLHSVVILAVALYATPLLTRNQKHNGGFAFLKEREPITAQLVRLN